MSDKPKIGFGAEATAEPKKKKPRKKKAAPELTPKQARAVQGRIEGKSMYKASIDAGFSESMARASSTKVFTPEAREVMVIAMENAGITPELMARRMRRNLNAQVVKTATFEGAISDVRRFRDGRLINETIELACKLRGDLKQDAGGNNNQVVVIIDRIGRPRSADSVAAAAGNFMVVARPKSG